MPDTIVPVILCGGAGRRLRPLSRAACPKPFLRIRGKHTMLQQTALRVQSLGAPVLVMNATLAARAAEDLATVGVKAGQMILEPGGRNTAPALVAAALEHPESLLLVLPSDHWIGRPDIFRQAVSRAVSAVREGWIVSFGVRPTRAETGFGYIRRGPVVTQGIHRIDRFIEKPPRAIARTLVRGGTCDWNSGMFLLAARTVLEEFRRFEPRLVAQMEEALRTAQRTAETVILGAEFLDVLPMSIDVAIMERSDRTLVVPVDMDWDDLGTWPAVLRRIFA